MAAFKLTETFLSKYRDKQPNWGFGPLSYFVYKRCVSIETPILCSDLVWRPAGDLLPGQGIIGFDEEPILINKTHKRSIKYGTITHNSIEKAQVMGIELEDGTILYATPDHQWLVTTNSTDTIVRWRYTKDLLKSKKGFDTFLLRPFGKMWSERKDFDAGFISAAYDGEGNLDRLNGISFTQVQNGMLTKVEELLIKEKFPFTKSLKSSSTSYRYKNTRQDCYSLRTSGYANVIRFLGEFQPPRLINKFTSYLVEKTLDNTSPELRCSPDNYVKVVRVFDAGEKLIAVMSTSLKTHFTGGFASHNTYSRTKDDGTQEEFFDTIKRCVEGSFTIQWNHCINNHLPWDAFKAQKSAQVMFEKMWNFKFLPPGRGMWIMGTPILEKLGSTPLLNCGFVSTKEIHKNFAEPFAWACDMLMLGVGIGYDTLGANRVLISKRPTGLYNCLPIKTYQIPDTREGWVESIKLLLSNYIEDGRKEYIEFDYDLIRGAGAPIKGFGGTASGPGPLREGHKSLIKLLDSYDGKYLDSVGIVDIFNYIGKFVVAGNVRRSAEIALGSIDDQDFISMKDFNLYPNELNDRRWLSNNSVVATPHSDFSKITYNISVNGEPGIILLDNARAYGRTKDGRKKPSDYKYDPIDGFNPCAEQGLASFECCNLVENFVANHDTPEEFYETLKYAYLYAKSVTLLPTHCEKTNQIMLQNRRIGCSQSGIQQAIKKFGIQKYLTDFCDKGYEVISHWDNLYSRWLGIPTSIKMTTVKPSGTISLLAGATPGVHCTHSEYYLRTIRIAGNSPLVSKLKEANFRIEPSVTDSNTLVVYFPVKENNFTKSKYDISLWEQLTLVKELQYYWSDNAVSCTVTFKPEEVKDLKSAIEYFSPYVKTLSFLPLENHNYAQAPYQTITQTEYDTYVSQLLELDFSDTVQQAKGEKYCTNDSCSLA